MEAGRLQSLLGRLQAAWLATSDFLGRISLWRFLGLSLLLLIAASIASDVFFGDDEHERIVIKKRAKASRERGEPVEVRIDEKGIAIRRVPEQRAGSDRNTAKEANADAPGKDARAEASAQEGKDQAPVAASSATTDTPDTSFDTHLTRKKKTHLVDLVLLLILAMFITRLVANARLRAEARAAAAEESATCEALNRQLAEARLQAMQAQVEPHFLFNTLAAVEHLIETDPPRAAQMQRNLIGYLRSVLPNLRRSESTLGRESEICRHYLEILRMRMEKRLSFEIAVPAGLASASVPPLMLQSLVENAIQHGIEPQAEGGSVRLSAEVVDGRLAIVVEDTGVGFGVAPSVKRTGGGVGLSNIRERLQALHGDRARLGIHPHVPHGTRVVLELPYVVSQTADRPDR